VSHQSGLDIVAEIRLAYEDGAADQRHTTEVESTMYRLVQEALTNAVKHAGAARVEVAIDDRSGTIDIQVRDDGRGFDAEDVGAGFGLLGMRERVGIVNGTLEVQSQIGRGTTVRARIPSVRRQPELPLSQPA
jgi:two-component system, NarL family, sensor histidine kinase DevS